MPLNVSRSSICIFEAETWSALQVAQLCDRACCTMPFHLKETVIPTLSSWHSKVERLISQSSIQETMGSDGVPPVEQLKSHVRECVPPPFTRH